MSRDECYHLACDTMKNLNLTALDQFSDAVAHSTLTFANDLCGERNGYGLRSSTTSSENRGHHKVR